MNYWVNFFVIVVSFGFISCVSKRVEENIKVNPLAGEKSIVSTKSDNLVSKTIEEVFKFAPSTVKFKALKDYTLDTSEKENCKDLGLRILKSDTVFILSHQDTGWFFRDSTGKEITRSILKGEKKIFRRKVIPGSSLKILSEILGRENKEVAEVAGCFQPHHAIILIKNNNASFIDVCFTCRGIDTSGDINFEVGNFDNRKWDELELFFRNNGFNYVGEDPYPHINSTSFKFDSSIIQAKLIRPLLFTNRLKTQKDSVYNFNFTITISDGKIESSSFFPTKIDKEVKALYSMIIKEFNEWMPAFKYQKLKEEYKFSVVYDFQITKETVVLRINIGYDPYFEKTFLRPLKPI